MIIGKANLSEWANFRSTHSTSGWSGVGGQTTNPYVLDRNPCGSSSGSAAGRRRQPRHGRHRHRDRRLDRLPVRARTASSASSRRSAWSAGRRRAALGRAGHRRPDRPHTSSTPRSSSRSSAASDPPTRDPRRRPFLKRLPRGPDPNGLRGKRIGVWGSTAPARDARPTLLARAQPGQGGDPAARRHVGRHLPFQDEAGAPRPRRWSWSSSTTSTPTWPPAPGNHPRTSPA